MSGDHPFTERNYIDPPLPSAPSISGKLSLTAFFQLAVPRSGVQMLMNSSLIAGIPSSLRHGSMPHSVEVRDPVLASKGAHGNLLPNSEAIERVQGYIITRREGMGGASADCSKESQWLQSRINTGR